jgi:8-oxo-dGTP pyrophosphatase MutT (NUDIX family)
MRRLVAAVVFRKSDGKFLVLKRKLHWKGWEFVKGQLSRETFRQAALRELREETGIKHARIICKLPPEVIYHHKDISGHKVSMQKALLVEYIHGPIRLSFEHSCYKWVTAKEAHRMLTHISHKTFLKFADKHVREFEARLRKKLVDELSRKHPTSIRCRGNKISLTYDGKRMTFRVIRTTVKDVAEWSLKKNIIYYDRNLNPASILPILIHEAVEKHVAQKYDMDEDKEAHKIASAVEKEFIADKKWISQQRMVADAWVKANHRKVGSLKFY